MLHYSNDSETMRVIVQINIDSKREKGRPKKKGLNGIENNIKIVGVNGWKVGDRDL